jgi:hypothetical protein
MIALLNETLARLICGHREGDTLVVETINFIGGSLAIRWQPSPLTFEPGYEMFEYACHKDNYAMRNRFSGAHAAEAREAAVKK